MCAMLLAQILGYAIQFTAQTVILFVALWIMIKIQDLNLNFPGLIGAAAAATALEMVLDHFLSRSMGFYLASSISTPIVCGVLCFCTAKATSTTQVFDMDVVFTVAVAYALTFAMNLFVIGALMGDLRPSDIHADSLKENVDELGGKPDFIADTNKQTALTQPTNQLSEKIITLGKTPKKTGATNSAKLTPAAGPQDKSAKATTKPAGKSKELDPAEQARETAKKFSVKGITKSVTNPMAVINNGVKTYTMGVGESFSMQTPGGIIKVRCEEVGEDSVVLNVAGERVTLVLQ
jgi:hypothetical protein